MTRLNCFFTFGLFVSLVLLNGVCSAQELALAESHISISLIHPSNRDRISLSKEEYRFSATLVRVSETLDVTDALRKNKISIDGDALGVVYLFNPSVQDLSSLSSEILIPKVNICWR